MKLRVIPAVFVSLAALVAVAPAALAQAPSPYAAPGQPTYGAPAANPYGGGTPYAPTGANPYAPANPYSAPANPYAAPASPYGAAPGAAPPGPIVARPFTAEPPKPLIGERLREEPADPRRVAIEAFTDAKIEDVDKIPVVNTLAEYQAVKEAEEPAILFDGKVFFYVKETGVYEPLNYRVEQDNQELWQYIQAERQAEILQYQQRAFQEQQARLKAAYGNLGRTAYPQPYGRIPGRGAGQYTGYGTRPSPGAGYRAPAGATGAYPAPRR